jgi:hypothetical protein
MSSATRLLGVFVSPASTFADIAAEPHFILAISVGILAGFGFALTLLQRVGAVAVARESLLANARTRALSPDQFNQAVATSAKVFQFSFYLTPVINIAFLLLLALIFLGIANFLLGYEATFKQALGVTAHAYLVQSVYAVLMIVFIFLMPNPQAFNIANPLGSNLGYFLNQSTTSPFLYAMATHLDVFTLWTIVLLALGLSKLSRKGRFAGAFWAVFSLWLFYALVVSGLAAAFA